VWLEDVWPKILPLEDMLPYLLTPSAVCFVLLTAAATLAEKPITREEHSQ